MEKHHFKDRSKIATQYNLISPGMVVAICPKESQRTAKSIEDLTKGIVIKLLTKKNHPRGLKCIIYPIHHSINPTYEQIEQVLRYCEIHEKEILSEKGPIAAKFKKGRITYVFDMEGNII